MRWSQVAGVKLYKPDKRTTTNPSRQCQTLMEQYNYTDCHIEYFQYKRKRVQNKHIKVRYDETQPETSLFVDCSSK